MARTASDGAEASLARNTAVVSALTLASRATGFARALAILAVLGINRFSDLYVSANLVPNYTHEFVTGSLITALLVPPLVRHLDSGDLRSMRRTAGGFLTLVSLLGMVVVLVVVAAGGLVVRLLTLGVTDSAESADLLRIGWPLIALLMPQVVLYAVAATGAAVQNAVGRFALAAGAPILENLGIIAVIGLWQFRYGGAVAPAEVQTGHIVFLGLGTTGAVAAHAALQWIGAARCGVALFPRRGWRNPEVREIVRLGVPSIGYAGLNAGRLVAFLVAANVVVGGQAVFQFGLNFFNLPTALVAKPVATTVMPVLSGFHQRAQRVDFSRRFRASVGLILVVVVPAAALLAALARPVAVLTALGEADTETGVTLLAAAIGALALAVPGDSLFWLSTSASYARLDARSPLNAMLLRLFLSLIGAAAVAALFDGWQVLFGLGVVMAVADAAGSMVLTRSVLRGLPRPAEGRLSSDLFPHLLFGVLGGLVAGWVVWAGWWLVGEGRPAVVATAAVAGLCGGGAAVMLHRVRGTSEVAGFLGRPVAAGGDLAPEPPAEVVLGSPAREEPVPSLEPRVLAPVGRLGIPSLDPQPVLGAAPAPLWQTSTLGLAFVVLATALGASLAVLGPLSVAALVGVLIVAAVAYRPEWGPMILLATTPLTVGILRGTFIPFLRPNEALLFAVVAGVGLHLLIGSLYSLFGWIPARRFRLAGVGGSRLDLAVCFLALSGSVLPLLVRFGRGREVSIDDLTQSFVVGKFCLLYLVVRVSIRTLGDVRRCVQISMVASVPVALLALGQSLGVPGVDAALSPWRPFAGEFAEGRGAATIGNAIALGDVMAVQLAVALMVLFRRLDLGKKDEPGRPTTLILLGLVGVFSLGAVGSGQFSAVIAAGIAVVAVTVAGRRPETLFGLPIAGGVAGIALWPVVAKRLEGFTSGSGLPQSWQVRIENLQAFFLPVLGEDFNWALGVRPDTSVDNPNEILGETFIESGILWLLWVGGVLLLAAFVVLLVVAFRLFVKAARARDPWLAAVGGAGIAATLFIAVLTITDPHLTMRGIADVYFPLLAFGVLAARAPAIAPARRVSPAATPSLGRYRYAPVGRGAKRLVDVVVSVVLLVVLAPVFAAIAVAIKVGDRGPVLFRQERVGFAEQVFTIWKFRTMKTDNDSTQHREFVQAMLRAESDGIGAGDAAESGSEGSGDAGPAFKLGDADDRITRVGRLLRRTSLDELPQLVNVLRGQMSLVGPRPCLDYEVTEYDPRHRLRALSVPGMTGLWQVEGRSDLHMRDALDLDVRYVESCSFGGDLHILVRTVGVVARGSGV